MSQLKVDILVDIPDCDLPLLAKIYKEHVSRIPHVLSFINTSIKWKKSDTHCKYLTFMSPNDSWKIDGTFIALIECYCYDLFVFTLDKDCVNLYEGLMKTQRINFKRRVLFYSLHEDHIPVVNKFVEAKHLTTNFNVPCVMNALPPEKALEYSTEYPSETYIKKLNGSNIPQINSVWPHKYEDSEQYLKTYIHINGGYGLFLKSNDELVAWILKMTCGHLALLQTEEAHKKKGYASVVLKVMSKEIAQEGHWPYATVVAENTVSLKLFRKLGFQVIGMCVFKGVQEMI